MNANGVLQVGGRCGGALPDAEEASPRAAPGGTEVARDRESDDPQVALGGQQRFTAAVTGSTVTSVTWSIQEGASGGTVNSAGLYTAPGSSGTYHVVVRSVADSTKSATATVTVTRPRQSVAVQVTPASTTVAAGGQRSVHGDGDRDQRRLGELVRPEGASGGAVDAAGLYTAPAAAGTYHVKATSVADPDPVEHVDRDRDGGFWRRERGLGLGLLRRAGSGTRPARRST